MGPPWLGPGISLIKDHITKGSWAEATAVAWLLARGYLVAKNVSGWGCFDIIAVKEDYNRAPEITLIDVKSYNSKHYTYSPLTKPQSWAGVRVLLVSDDGHCEFIEKGKENIKKGTKDEQN